METARAQRFASPAFVIAVAVGLMAILGPLAGTAGASHTTIDASPNSDTNLVGTSHTVTATSSVPGVFVNFNIEAGPNDDGGPASRDDVGLRVHHRRDRSPPVLLHL